VRSAVVRLGFTMVQNVAIAVGLKQLTQAREHSAILPLIEGLWKRSLRVAALSYVIARRFSRQNPEAAMLAGLLHEIGKFYILTRSSKYTQLFTDEAALWEIVDHWHAHIAGAILESWQLPDEIAFAVRDHREYQRTHAGPPDLTDVIMAADYLDMLLQKKMLHEPPWGSPPTAIGYLGLTQEMSQTLLKETQKELNQLIQALS
jgi:HD-like signal output (HDOD) protein